MSSIESLKQRIDHGLLDLGRGEPKELYQAVAHTLALKAKRFRPLLLMLMNRLAGGRDDDALPASLGIELLHSFTLVHDDIMDEARLRRGEETVWSKYGHHRAILAGDLMFVLAYEHIAQSPTDALPVVLNLFNRAAREVCEGQHLDLEFEQRDKVSMEEYLRMVELKTAAMIAGAASIGTAICSRSNQRAEMAWAFGTKLGIAFQIQDDILDTYGDSSRTGKGIGGDIVRKKKTFLLLAAMDSLADDALLRATSPSGIMALFERAGVRGEAEAARDHYFNHAMTLLHDLGGDNEARNELASYCTRLLNRDH